jgi:Bacterial Ig domain
MTVGVCLIGTVNVVANGTDPEGNYPLVVTGAIGATLGTAAVSGSTSIRFNAFGGTGGEFLTYTVRDSLGAISTELLAVNVVDLQGCSSPTSEGTGR